MSSQRLGGLAESSSEASDERRDLLVFPERVFEKLRNSLLLGSEETAAFLLAAPVLTPQKAWRLIVREVIELESKDYSVRSSSSIEIPPQVLAPIIAKAREEQLSVVMVHSHPAGSASPSPRDYDGESRLVPALWRRVPDVPHARLIIAPTEHHSAIFTPESGLKVLREHALSVIQVSSEVTYFPTGPAVSSDYGQPALDETASSLAAYDRQIRAFGVAGQRRLRGLRVTIVGLGGTGSIVAQQLAHLGVGSFLLIDPDVVDASTLNRLSGVHLADVGRPKVEVAADYIRAVNPTARVRTLIADVCQEITARRILDTDVFFSCTDSHGSRWVLSQLSYQFVLPGFDVGVVINPRESGPWNIVGRVQMLAPGLPCLACGNLLDPEQVRRDLLTVSQRAADPYIVGEGVPQPSVMSINGVASSLAVTMFLSAFVGVPNAARHQQLRLELGIVSRIEGPPNAECILCSKRGVFAAGDSGGTLGRKGET